MCRILAPTAALLVACSGENPDTYENIGETQAAVVGVDTHLYLRCNATTFNLTDASRLKAGADPKVFTLDYNVQQSWMVSPNGGDTCVFTETNQLNGWGTTSKHYSRSGSGAVIVQASGNLVSTGTSESQFPIKYPKLGTFRMTVNTSASTWTYSVQEKPATTITRPQTLVQKIGLIIYDSSANAGATAKSLANGIVARIEQAANEPAAFQPSTGFQNVDLQIAETTVKATATPKLSGSTSADYNAIIDSNGICTKINNGIFDEVWLYADDGGGFAEALMAGPAASIYDTNGGPITRADCQRPVHIMGLNYQVGVDNALESFAHRIENTMAKFLDSKNRGNVVAGDTWFEFDGQVGYAGTLYQKGYCGNAHWAPNATKLADDYDMDLLNKVSSDCLNWTPQHTGLKTDIDCTAWGCNREGYLTWWMKRFPGACKSRAMTKANAQAMPNWWKAIYRNTAAIDTTYSCN